MGLPVTSESPSPDLRLSAALLPSPAPVAVPLGAHVDRVLLPLALPLRPALTLLLGPQHHVGEGHEHLAAAETRREMRHGGKT